MKVALIIPYFGKFPKWFELYLYSCSRNECVDFIFYTDCTCPAKIYTNTYFIKTDFKSYCKQVSDALGINFSPISPYKLCDLKPFYGIIHKNDLKNYDFWGFGDIDLIYGDLNIIVNESNLSDYDFITTHGGRVAGHFTIMRYDSKYTEMCKSIPDWRRCLEDRDKNYVLDEVAFAYVAYPQLKTICRIYHYIIRTLHLASEGVFYNWANSLFCNRRTRRLFWEYNTTPCPKPEEEWTYDIINNRLFKSGKNEKVMKLPYLHFLLFKKNIYFDSDNYWRGDYYTVEQEFIDDNTCANKTVVISINGIKPVKNTDL